jgi:hypothetical protein
MCCAILTYPSVQPPPKQVRRGAEKVTVVLRKLFARNLPTATRLGKEAVT